MGRADAQTSMTYLAVAFRNFENISPAAMTEVKDVSRVSSMSFEAPGKLCFYEALGCEADNIHTVYQTTRGQGGLLHVYITACL
jgi:hypothetical protein